MNFDVQIFSVNQPSFNEVCMYIIDRIYFSGIPVS